MIKIGSQLIHRWTGNSDAYEALEIPLGSAVETRKFKILVNTANVYWGQFRIDGLEVWGDTRDYRDFLPGAALSTTAETMSGSALDNVKDPNHAWGWVSAGTDFAGKEFVIDIGSSILADKLVIGSIWARDMALSNIDVYYDAGAGWQLLLDDYALPWSTSSASYEALSIPFGEAVSLKKLKLVVNAASTTWGNFRIDGLELWGEPLHYGDLVKTASLSTTAGTMSGSALDNVKDPNHAWGWVSADADFAGKEFIVDFGSSVQADKLVLGSIWAKDMAISNLDLYYETADGWQLLLNDCELPWNTSSASYEALTIPFGGTYEMTKLKLVVNAASTTWGQYRIDGLEVWGELPETDQTLAVRPLSLGIEPVVSETDGSITFTLNEPCNLSIEPFGAKYPLHLFANPPDTHKPDLSADNVVVFEPGVHSMEETDTASYTGPMVYYFKPGHHIIHQLLLNDGDTVYVAGGAYVSQHLEPDAQPWIDWNPFGDTDMRLQKSTFFSEHQDNIRIYGRGVIDGGYSIEQKHRHTLVELRYADGIDMEGVILKDSSAWTLWLEQSRDIHVDNIKILGYYVNNDGIEISACHDTLIENSFCHNADDSFIVKAWLDASNITVQNCTVWNDVAQSFGAVYEIYGEVSDITFRDCTVIRSTGGLWTDESGGVLSLWNTGGGNIHDVLFENIVIEEATNSAREALKVSVTDNPSGKISNIRFKNIAFLDTANTDIKIKGPDGSIQGVTFENVSLNGEPVLSESDARFRVTGNGLVYSVAGQDGGFLAQNPHFTLTEGESADVALKISRTGAALAQTGTYVLTQPADCALTAGAGFTAGTAEDILTLHIPGTLEKGIHLVEITPQTGDAYAQKLYCNITVTDSVRLTDGRISRAADGQGFVFTAQAENLSTRNQITGTLTLSDPSWNGATAVSSSVTLAPGGKTAVSIPLPEPVGQGYQLSCTAALSDGRTVAVSLDLPFGTVAERQTPVIDGTADLSGWTSAHHFVLDQSWQTNHSGHYWTGTDDLMADCFLTYDENNLYLAAVVTDDIHKQTGSGEDVLYGDALRLAVSPGNGASYDGVTELLFARTDSGETVALKSAASGWQALSANAAVSRSEETHQTVYKLAVPWSELGVQNAQLPSAIGFALNLYENDGPAPRGILYYGKTLNTYKDCEGLVPILLPSELPPAAADYAAVASALALVPKDLSLYTDESVRTLEDDLAAIVEGKTAGEQSVVDRWAADLLAALDGLALKTGEQVGDTTAPAGSSALDDETSPQTGSDFPMFSIGLLLCAALSLLGTRLTRRRAARQYS